MPNRTNSALISELSTPFRNPKNYTIYYLCFHAQSLLMCRFETILLQHLVSWCCFHSLSLHVVVKKRPHGNFFEHWVLLHPCPTHHLFYFRFPSFLVDYFCMPEGIFLKKMHIRHHITSMISSSNAGVLLYPLLPWIDSGKWQLTLSC